MRKTKGSVKCFYYHKFGYIPWNCRVYTNGISKGKKVESTNIADFEDDPEFDEDDRPN